MSRPPARLTLRRSRRRLVGALLVGTVLGLGAAPAWAWFSDTATVTTAPSTAHVLARPDATECTAALLTATVSWPEKDPRYDYEVVLRRVATGAVVSTRSVTGAATSTTYSGLLDFGLVVGAGQVDFQAEVRSRLATAPTWTSADTRTSATIRVFAVAVGATASCIP
jgi:predicted ribosomally synthesized peptide with SipW-like signal peptide